MAKPDFETMLRSVSDAGYANGYMACVLEIGAELMASNVIPTSETKRIFEKFAAAARELPGWKAAQK